MANGKGGMANGKASGIAKGEKSQEKWGECNTLYNMLCTALLLLALAFWVNPLTQLVELWFLT